jgi:hypothetical protein
MRQNPEYKMINYKNLLLDPCNPRIPKSMHSMDEKGIINFLLLEASTLELMQAIGENDFFRGEQLLVVPVDNEKYKVLEGNRRLTSVKLLNEPDLAAVKKISVQEIYGDARYHPKEIPCLVFSEENEIRKYLGYRHITGIKAWGLTEKSRYLHQLYKDSFEGQSFDDAAKELAKMIGSRKEYVKRILVAYELYLIVEDEGFYRIKDLDDTTFYVGYLVDSLSRSNISDFVGVDIDSHDIFGNLNKLNLKKLIFWFFEKNEQNQTRLKSKGADLTKLNAVLGDKIATEAFSNGKSLDGAYELTEDTGLIFFSNVQRALHSLEQADSIVLKIDVFYSDLEEDLIHIRKLTSKIKQVKDELQRKGEFGNDDEF